MDKKIFVIIAVVAVVFLIGGIVFGVMINSSPKTTTSQSSKNTVASTSTKNKASNTVANTVKNETKKESEVKGMYSTGKHHATIVIKDYGTIKLELDADIAPITVANFAELVNKGFYNGITFHRIMSGFMIQGGDPTGTGMGGSDKKIKGEFKANGVNNSISHVRGVISMARAASYDSASSQFFIVHEDSLFLDGQYAGFGKVTEGMEVVDAICEATPVEDSNGKVLKENQPIIEKITMDD